MLSRPLVSVIIPVYNNELYIGECLDTILGQTYTNLQVIIVDDGSTDHTYEICKSYQDHRMVLVSKTNGGASSARNVGLRYAKGEYVYFQDSDDYLETNAIEKLVSLIIEKNGDCVFFEAENYTDDDDLKIKKDGLIQKTEYPIQSGDSLIPQLLVNKDYHAAPFLYFIHRSVYEGLFFEEGIMFEDELFTFQMLKKCNRIVSLREKLYHRRVRPGSVMTSAGKGLFRFHSITRVFERLLEIYQNNKSDIVLKQYLVRIALLWFGYWRNLLSDEKSTVKEKYEILRKLILESKGFGSFELVIRCFGYHIWLAYIAPGRCIRRIKRRRLR